MEPLLVCVLAPKVDNIDIPTGVDRFGLSFEDYKKYSAVQNFEILGHSYFKIPERTAWASTAEAPATPDTSDPSGAVAARASARASPQGREAWVAL